MNGDGDLVSPLLQAPHSHKPMVHLPRTLGIPANLQRMLEWVAMAVKHATSEFIICFPVPATRNEVFGPLSVAVAC